MDGDTNSINCKMYKLSLKIFVLMSVVCKSYIIRDLGKGGKDGLH